MLRIQKHTASSVAQNDSVPLKQVHVDARIRSFATDVTLTQVFQNDESVPIEAVYCFPVEENAAIYAFIARIDNEREIVAELKEKKTAQKEYTEALAEGHGAYLFEQDEASNDIFVVSVGALQPGSECRITISYVSELDLIHCDEKPKIRFVIPTTIAPRYSPSHHGITSPGGTQTNYVQSAPYTIEFVCQIDKLDQHVAGISSPSHPIMIDFNNGNFFLVTLNQQTTYLDREIIVDIELSQTRTNTIAAVEEGALMVSFMPNEENCQQGSNGVINEFLFVIDCSGSMDDDNKIGLARNAMLLFLKSLPVKCRFNIIRFGSSFSALFNDQVTREYNENNMSQAQVLIKGMKADLGGTELLEPLLWLKKHDPPMGSVRQVFLLTDGEVSNVDQVTNLCREMATGTRIFSFGLGHSPSRALIKGLARVTHGRFTFIAPKTSVDVHVAEQLTRALQPSIINLHVKWTTHQSVLHSMPKNAPPVFAHDRLLFYALLDESIPFDHATTVELFSDTNEQPLAVAHVDHIPVTLTSKTVTRLAAKTLLRELICTSEAIAREHIVELSLRYGILCPYTTFIGVERRLGADSDNNAAMKLCEVPIVLSPIWSHRTNRFYALSYASPQHSNQLSAEVNAVVDNMRQNQDKLLARDAALSMIESRSCLLECSAQQFCSSARTLKQRKTFMSSFGCVLKSTVGYVSSLFTKDRADSHASSHSTIGIDCPTCKSSVDSSVIHEESTTDSQMQHQLQIDWSIDEHELVSSFIEQQKFDGLWVLTEYDIKQLTGKSLNDFSSSTVDSVEKNYQNSVITTVVVIILLETRCASQKMLWQALSIKASTRLKELLGGDETMLQRLLKNIRDQLSQASI